MGNLFAEAKLKTALANDTYTDKKGNRIKSRVFARR